MASAAVCSKAVLLSIHYLLLLPLLIGGGGGFGHCHAILYFVSFLL